MPIERENTDTLLMMLEDGYAVMDSTRNLKDRYGGGIPTQLEIVRMCLNYMSEEQVTDMMRLNGLLEEDENGEN